MAGSRALWQDQTAPPLTPEEVKENAKQAKKHMMIDKIPGDKGSTVGTLRARKEAMKKAIEEQTE